MESEGEVVLRAVALVQTVSSEALDRAQELVQADVDSVRELHPLHPILILVYYSSKHPYISVSKKPLQTFLFRAKS